MSAIAKVASAGLHSSNRFATVHVSNYVLGGVEPLVPGVLFNLALVAAVGTVLGVVDEDTENLLVPIFVHGLTDKQGECLGAWPRGGFHP